MGEYADWCAARGVTHAHCPCGCEHPQPFLSCTGLLICGACWALARAWCAMVPCTPAACGPVVEVITADAKYL
jgi:hypothetical protein